MVSALDSASRSGGPGSWFRVPVPGRDTALCSWARHFILIVPLSSQVYKWVPANLLLGVTLRWTSIPLLVASCYGNRDKLRPDGPLGSYTDFTFGKSGKLNPTSFYCWGSKSKLQPPASWDFYQVSVSFTIFVYLFTAVFTRFSISKEVLNTYT